LRAHLEDTHGGPGSVIGDVLNDGETGSAVGAIGERVAVSSVLRVENLFQTGLTGCDIRGDKLVFTLLSNAMANLKAGIALRQTIGYSYVLEASQRRRHHHQILEESVQSMPLTLDLNLNVA
jgi:hypothetical protein